MFSGLNFGTVFLRMTFLPEPKPNPGVPVRWRCPRRLGVDPCRILICWAVSSSEDETEVLEWGLWIMLRRFLGRGLFSEPFFDEFLLLTLVGFWNPSVGIFSTWFKTFLSSSGSLLVRGDIHKEWKEEHISVDLLSRRNQVENQTRFHFISDYPRTREAIQYAKTAWVRFDEGVPSENPRSQVEINWNSAHKICSRAGRRDWRSPRQTNSRPVWGCSSLKMNECNLIASIKTRCFDNSVSADETSKFAFS